MKTSPGAGVPAEREERVDSFASIQRRWSAGIAASGESSFSTNRASEFGDAGAAVKIAIYEPGCMGAATLRFNF